jgi:hypothetical protein
MEGKPADVIQSSSVRPSTGHHNEILLFRHVSDEPEHLLGRLACLDVLALTHRHVQQGPNEVAINEGLQVLGGFVNATASELYTFSQPSPN